MTNEIKFADTVILVDTSLQSPSIPTLNPYASYRTVDVPILRYAVL